MDYLKIITAILIWSSLGIFVRKIDMSNTGLIFYPSLIAGLLQVIILSFTGSLKKSLSTGHNIKNTSFLLLVPVFFMANSLLFYFAFRNTTIGNAVFAHYIAPVFVALLAPLLLNEKIHKSSWTAIILSSIGLWFILKGTSSNENHSMAGRENLGVLAAAMSGLAYAFLILSIRKIASHFDSLFIICVQNLVATAILFPFVLSIPVSLKDLPILIILGLAHSTLAPLLYVQGFRSTKANEAAILGYIEPVGAIILAYIFLDEIPGTTALLGGLLVLYSGYLVLRGSDQRSSVE